MPISIRQLFAPFFLFCFFFIPTFSADAQSGRRVAFVIGNEAYQSSELPRLHNPARDVDLMTQTLEEMGFEVWPKEKRANLTLSEMERERKIFKAAAHGAAIGLIYYAGHAMQDAGVNYFFPIDAKPTDFFELQRQSLSLDEMMDSLSGVTQLRIGLFDACRDNDLIESLRLSDPSRAAQTHRGLAPVRLETGDVRSLIAFPTQMGQVTTDGVAGTNSPFAHSLARRLPQQAGLRNVLGYVTDDVKQATRHAERPQLPEVATNIGGEDFFLMGLPEGAQISVDPAQKALCEEAAHPDDPKRPVGVAGTHFDVLQPDRHLAACQTWAWSAPKDGRPWAILARLHDKAKRGGQALEAARRGADLSDPEAMVMMSVIYEEGYPDVPQDYAQAVDWCRKAADLGSARGMHCLGWLHENGHGLPKDEAQAAAWYRKAAEAGNPSGMTTLGWIYENGWGGVAQDYAQALNWYRKAVEAGGARGMNNLGLMYRNGRGVPKDEKQAADWYLKAAEAGYAWGMHNLGWMYENGRGVSQDYAQALDWYRKAAEAGNGAGMNNLGWMYENGRGVPQSDEQAVSWYRKAAEAEDGNAMANLGGMYANGRGLPKDETQALDWYRKAADAGNGRGMQALGWRYANGSGVLKDDVQAVEWYKKAVEAGNAAGMNSLGVMYQRGRGDLPQDDEKAVEWYQKAAEAGNAWGMNNLGWMYRNGRGGLPKDEAKALEWFRKSAEAGNLDARDGIGEMQGWESEAEASRSYNEAAEAAAKAKDAETLVSIARRYEHGDGAPRDYGQAMEWYKKAAEAGSTDGMFSIGLMHEWGMGVPNDIWEALEWYRKAADAGDVRSMLHISDLFKEGRSFDDGHGFPSNIREAMKWIRRAAEAGNAQSMIAVGIAHTDAVRLLPSISAAMGEPDSFKPDSEAILQFQRLRDSGLARDDAQARFWFEKALASDWEFGKEFAQAALKAMETLPPEAPSRAAQPMAAAPDAPAALATLGGAVPGGLIGGQFGGGQGRTVAAPTGGGVTGVIGDQIGKYLTMQDLTYAQNAALQALEARSPTNWSNPETGAYGAFAPVPPYFNDQFGRLCTNYRHQVQIRGGQPFIDVGVMCKMDNGDWRGVGAQ